MFRNVSGSTVFRVIHCNGDAVPPTLLILYSGTKKLPSPSSEYDRKVNPTFFETCLLALLFIGSVDESNVHNPPSLGWKAERGQSMSRSHFNIVCSITPF
jgi:hypothetical protein